ncbi:MAG TPA: type II toxin-antitoxin system VapC family toxin [Candidatus Limnocylindria bacterium]|nr:type II toxin-antitoxin system VapC family toxin [Candidatus Limnocylindria bacterium]
MTTVVDASVVLAWLQDEPGADEAEPMLMEGLIGAPNWSEVLQKARQNGAPADIVARLLTSFGLKVVDATEADARVAADLWRRSAPLSLADRFCLALGVRTGLPVATTDGAWADVAGQSRVIVIR